MGISLMQYRQAIGTFNPLTHGQSKVTTQHTSYHIKLSGYMTLCFLFIFVLTAASNLQVQANDIEKNPGPSDVIRGSYNQGSPVFPASSRGRQCVANSFAAMLYSQFHRPNSWNTSDLDNVLCIGDKLYNLIPKSAELLLPSDLPRYISCKQKYFQAQFEETITGCLHIAPPSSIYEPLPLALARALLNKYALLCMGTYCTCVMTVNGSFFIFDSHSRNSAGLPSSNGKCILLRFSSLDSLCSHINNITMVMKVIQFDATPVKLIPFVLKKILTDGFLRQGYQCILNIDSTANAENQIQGSTFPVSSDSANIMDTSMMLRLHITAILVNYQSYAELCNMKDLNFIINNSILLNNFFGTHDSEWYLMKLNSGIFVQIGTSSLMMTSLPPNHLSGTKLNIDQFLSLAVLHQYSIVKLSGKYLLLLKSSCKQMYNVFDCKLGEKDIYRSYHVNKFMNFHSLCNYFLTISKIEKLIQFIPIDLKRIHSKKRIGKTTPFLFPELNKHEKLSMKTQKPKNPARKRKCIKPHEPLQQPKRPRTVNLKPTCSIIYKVFFQKLQTSCEFLCTVCNQLWFKHSVKPAEKLIKLNTDIAITFDTNKKSFDGSKYVCNTCYNSIKLHNIPTSSVANGMKFNDLPPELQHLTELEERLVASRLPFMQLRGCGTGGQWKLYGNVINVVNNVETTVNSLPRSFDEALIIPVKLKRRQCSKNDYIFQNIRPACVHKAAVYLIQNSELQEGLTLNNNWLKDSNLVKSSSCSAYSPAHPTPFSLETPKSCNQKIDDSKIKSDDGTCFNADNTIFDSDEPEEIISQKDTLLDNMYIDKEVKALVFAPGEGNKPLSLFLDADSEYLAFPTIFAGKRRPQNSQRKVNVTYSALCKWELRSSDKRCAKNIPNIFYKFRKLQMKQICDTANICLRKANTRNDITAHDVLEMNKESLVRHDEGYRVLKNVKTSPAYWEQVKTDMFAMIRQLGFPTFFMSFSAADTHWPDLQMALARINLNENWSPEDIELTPWIKKASLVKQDPVTTVRHYHHRRQMFLTNVLKHKSNPIGKLIDYMYRFETQQRGSFHDHGLYFIEGAPNVLDNTDEEICDFVDKYITCDNNHTFIKYQEHKCSKKTCYKSNSDKCRFNFPQPPMKKTIILEPFMEDNLKAKHKPVFKKIHKTLKDNNFTLDIDFSAFLNIIDLSYEDYLLAIRSSLKSKKIFLKRTPSQTRINAYNKVLLSTWTANMDIQFCLEPWAVVMYIVKYMCKGQRGMSALMEAACNEANSDNKSLPAKIRAMGNIWTNQSEIPVQEAVSYLLQLPFRVSSRSFIFINSGPYDQRTGFIKHSEYLRLLEAESTDIFADNVIKRYSRRPVMLANWCLADFATKLNYKQDRKCKPSSNNEQNEWLRECDFEDGNEDDEKPISEETKSYKFEKGFLIIARKPKILRYVKYHREKDPENYYREQLFLFSPWRDEIKDLLKTNETYEAAYKNHPHLNEIEMISSKYNKFAEYLSNANINDLDTENSDIEESPTSDEEDVNYACFDPGENLCHSYYDLSNDLASDLEPTATCTYNTVTIPNAIPDESYLELIQSLNVEQRYFFDNVLFAFKTAQDPIYQFCTSGAGCGKTHLLKALYQALIRLFSKTLGKCPHSPSVILAAFTGKASYNIGGSTIHSLFNIPVHQSLTHYRPLSHSTLNTFAAKYMDLRVLIIDECSMVSNALFHFIDQRLQEIKGSNNPFGDVSILCFGDLYQLPPTHYGQIFEPLKENPFMENIWQKYFSYYELKTVMRQKDDANFAHLLNRLRKGEHTSEDVTLLKTRTISQHLYPFTETHLYYSNASIDTYNLSVFDKVTSHKVIIPAIDYVLNKPTSNIKRQILCKAKKLRQQLTRGLFSFLNVAVGLRYEITQNIRPKDGLTNGSSGILMSIDCRMEDERPSILWMLFDYISIGMQQRKIFCHLYNENICKSWTPILEVKCDFQVDRHNQHKVLRRQFPVRNSSAKSIHRSQGDTLKSFVIDFTNCKKVPALHYVGLSRATSLKSINIVELNEKAIRTNKCVHIEMERLQRHCLMRPVIQFYPAYMPKFNITIIFHNVQSLHKYFKYVSTDHNVLHADINIFAQTRLNSTDNCCSYNIPNFKMQRNDYVCNNENASRSVYGLALYHKMNIHVHDYQTENDAHGNQLIAFHVSSPTCRRLNIIAIYRSPNSGNNFSYFASLVKKYFIKLNLDDPLIIVGDFNINALQKDFMFKSLQLLFFNCHLANSDKTTDNNTIIDHVWTNIRQDFYLCNSLESHISDHKPIHFTILTSLL